MSLESRVRVSAGSLRDKISLQSVSNASDGQGGLVETWTTDETMYAKVDPISSRELYFAGKENAGMTHKITLRYNSSITNDKRFLFGSRVLQITSVRNILERDRKMVCFCEERV